MIIAAEQCRVASRQLIPDTNRFIPKTRHKKGQCERRIPYLTKIEAFCGAVRARFSGAQRNSTICCVDGSMCSGLGQAEVRALPG
jgi:hypothetical protein